MDFFEKLTGQPSKDELRQKEVAVARMEAVKGANDLLKIYPMLDSSVLFAAVREYGQGDPQALRTNLGRHTENESLKVILYMFCDMIQSAEHTGNLRIGWDAPERMPFDGKAMNTYQILKDGDLCEPIQPNIMTIFHNPITDSDEELTIRKMVVKPISSD